MKTIITYFPLFLFLLITQEVFGQVVSRDIDTTIYGTGTKQEFDLDFNLDGQIDFAFQYANYSTNFNSSFGSNTNNEVVCPGYHQLTVFDSGQTVGPMTTGWYNSTGDFSPSGFFYKSRLAYRFWGFGGSPNGNFANQMNKYVGLRFKINNNWHYGYIEVSIDVSSSAASHCIIHKIGYESTPNTAIQIGAQCATSSTSSLTTNACDSYIGPSGAIFTSSGTYTDVIQNQTGCDSTITLNLTIGNGFHQNITHTACDSYVSPTGNVYTSSGFYQDIVTGIAGCDSVYEVNLTINENTSNAVNEVVCHSYTSPSGAVFTESGFFTDIIPNAAGCDSVISINLAIMSPVVTVSKSGQNLIADMPSAKYQWLDCDNGYAVLAEEYDQTLVPASPSARYAVEITINGCKDTSECYSLETVGIEDDIFSAQIRLFPNPTQSLINIDLGEVLKEGNIELMTLTGQTVDRLDIHQQMTQFNLSHLSKGMYLVKIESGEKRAIFKIMKK